MNWIDLGRVAKLHKAVVDAGLPALIPSGYKLHSFGDDKWSLLRTYIDHDDGKTYGNTVDNGDVAQAAVSWWLEEWCYNLDEYHDETAILLPPNAQHYLDWAEKIVANRKDEREAAQYPNGVRDE
jgi:hypothetical protein